jgi:hypothetical protein
MLSGPFRTNSSLCPVETSHPIEGDHPADCAPARIMKLGGGLTIQNSATTVKGGTVLGKLNWEHK